MTIKTIYTRTFSANWEDRAILPLIYGCVDKAVRAEHYGSFIWKLEVEMKEEAKGDFIHADDYCNWYDEETWGDSEGISNLANYPDEVWVVFRNTTVLSATLTSV
jgi:hypothetical protein